MDPFAMASVGKQQAWRAAHRRSLAALYKRLTDPPLPGEPATEKEYKMKAVTSLVRLRADLLHLSKDERERLDKALYIATHSDFKKARKEHKFVEDAAEELAERYVNSMFRPAIHAAMRRLQTSKTRRTAAPANGRGRGGDGHPEQRHPHGH